MKQEFDLVKNALKWQKAKINSLRKKQSKFDLYRLMSKDEAFKQAMQDTIKRMLAS